MKKTRRIEITRVTVMRASNDVVQTAAIAQLPVIDIISGEPQDSSPATDELRERANTLIAAHKTARQRFHLRDLLKFCLGNK
jgi:hypothetical protein